MQFFSTILSKNNNLYMWGENSYGQFGNGTKNGSCIPINVSLQNGIKPTQVSTGGYYTIEIGSDGELYTSGMNASGQLGDGTTIDKYSLTKITLASGIKPTQIACGQYHTLVIGSDGELYGWGYNYYGQLGNGTNTAYNTTPLKISLPNEIKPKQIVCGDNYSMIIGSDNELYTSGCNGSGCLGDGTTTNKNIFTKITLANGVTPTKIVAGSSHSMKIGDYGNLYTWGDNSWGQLGDGTTVDKYVPTKIILPSGEKVTQIFCGYQHSLVIDNSNNLYGWGNNSHSQICNSSSVLKTPTKVDFNFD